MRKVERVRFDQDGNVVEDRAGGAAGAPPDPPTTRGDLDTVAHAIGLESAVYRLDGRGGGCRMRSMRSRAPRE